jgi:hypothetical protein
MTSPAADARALVAMARALAVWAFPHWNVLEPEASRLTNRRHDAERCEKRSNEEDALANACPSCGCADGQYLAGDCPG